MYGVIWVTIIKDTKGLRLGQEAGRHLSGVTIITCGRETKRRFLQNYSEGNPAKWRQET